MPGDLVGKPLENFGITSSHRVLVCDFNQKCWILDMIIAGWCDGGVSYRVIGTMLLPPSNQLSFYFDVDVFQFKLLQRSIWCLVEHPTTVMIREYFFFFSRITDLIEYRISVDCCMLQTSNNFRMKDFNSRKCMCGSDELGWMLHENEKNLYCTIEFALFFLSLFVRSFLYFIWCWLFVLRWRSN